MSISLSNTAIQKAGRAPAESRPQEWDLLLDAYFDSKVYSVDSSIRNDLFADPKVRSFSGVTIHLKDKNTGEEWDIDANQIKQQGESLNVFRCPIRACERCFVRRKLVERHFKNSHEDEKRQGVNWSDHPTCSTFPYGPKKSIYARRPKAVTDRIKAETGGKLPRGKRPSATSRATTMPAVPNAVDDNVAMRSLSKSRKRTFDDYATTLVTAGEVNVADQVAREKTYLNPPAGKRAHLCTNDAVHDQAHRRSAINIFDMASTGLPTPETLFLWDPSAPVDNQIGVHDQLSNEQVPQYQPSAMSGGTPDHSQDLDMWASSSFLPNWDPNDGETPISQNQQAEFERVLATGGNLLELCDVYWCTNECQAPQRQIQQEQPSQPQKLEPQTRRLFENYEAFTVLTKHCMAMGIKRFFELTQEEFNIIVTWALDSTCYEDTNR